MCLHSTIAHSFQYDTAPSNAPKMALLILDGTASFRYSTVYPHLDLYAIDNRNARPVEVSNSITGEIKSIYQNTLLRFSIVANSSWIYTTGGTSKLISFL